MLNNVDKMDVFQLKVQINLFRVSGVEDQLSLELMRLHLKKTLLEEILKVETKNRREFECNLKLVTQLIGKKLERKYDCCFSGCRYQSKRHRGFVKHLKITHPRVTNVKCNFRKVCLRVFANIEDLIKHVRDDHSALPDSDAARPDDPVTIDIPCKCIMHSCGSMHFQNVKMLMTHINTVHHNDARTCVFENCNQKFAPGYISRHHFRKKHMEAKNMKLGKIHLVNPLNASRGIINPDEINDETFDSDDRGDEVCVFTDGYDAFDIDNLENDECEPEEESEDFF